MLNSINFKIYLAKVGLRLQLVLFFVVFVEFLGLLLDHNDSVRVRLFDGLDDLL